MPFDRRNNFKNRPQRKDAGEKRSFGPRGTDRTDDRPGKRTIAKPSFGKPSFGKPIPPARRFDPKGAPARPPVQPASPRPAAPAAEPVAAEPLNPNLLYGRHPIREALKTGRDIEKLLVADGDLSGSARALVSDAIKQGIIVQNVDRNQLDRLARNHQGLVAFASAYSYATLEDILAVAAAKQEQPFVIVVDKVTDPQNLGAIIRSAACAGAHGVVVQQHRAVGLTPSAVKASAGAVEHVKVARVTNINQAIETLKKQGLWMYAADAKGTDYRTQAFDGACALVIGSEGEGISPLTLRHCDHVVSIPTTGAVDSLNASVAAGILMFAVYNTRHPHTNNA